MTVTITAETENKPWADADETDGGILIGMMASYEEESEGEESEYTKVDFERDLQKASRKIKK
ncbi:hypothetical protein ACFLVX_03880 [Chloroflexota bacterium]